MVNVDAVLICGALNLAKQMTGDVSLTRSELFEKLNESAFCDLAFAKSQVRLEDLPERADKAAVIKVTRGLIQDYTKTI